MQSPLNKYGEIEVERNEVQYTIPITHTETNDLEELEQAYLNKGKELMDNSLYLFAHDLQVIRNRYTFTFHLDEMKAYHYIRQLHFEEQVYYFHWLIELAKNADDTPVLWDKNNMLIDLTDGKIKTFVFGFPNHPLYSTQSTIDGLKEMILLGMTTLHRVIGKPRRIDFIDQREKVIRFAEELLRSKDIEEIEQLLNETIKEIEKKLEIERERLKEVKTKGYISQIKGLLKSEKFVAVTSEDPRTNYTKRKSNLPVPYEKKDKKPFYDNKYFFIASSVVALVILIGNSTGVFESSTQGTTEPKKVQEQEDQKVSNDEIVDIYRLALSGDKETALSELERHGYENLSKKDKGIMLQLYQETGQPEGAIKLEPEYTEDIVEDMIAKKEFEQIESLKEKVSDQPSINFEVAYLNGQWNEVLHLKSQVPLNDRRNNQIINAFLQSGKEGEATQFAEQQGKST